MVHTDKAAAQALTNLCNKTIDSSLDKFVRGCLRQLLTDEASAKYSWYGRHNNISVQSYETMNIIKECALKKFPNNRINDIIMIIKKWFNYAKDRIKKAQK